MTKLSYFILSLVTVTLCGTVLAATNNQVFSSQERAKLLAKIHFQNNLIAINQQILNKQKQKLHLLLRAYKETMKPNYKWNFATPGEVPQHAVSVGFDLQGPIYVCQAAYGTDAFKDVGYGIHPGQLTKEGCRISYDWKSYLKVKKYRVLTTANEVSWRSSYSLQPFIFGNVNRVILPMGTVNTANSAFVPVVGGVDLAKHKLYVCRCLYKNGVHAGKVVTGACDISWQGKEVRVGQYQVLFVKNTNGNLLPYSQPLKSSVANFTRKL